MRSRSMQGLVAVVAVCTAVARCGPNYRYVYDGEAAFERCYGSDFDTNATPAFRTTCWRMWLTHFTYGADPDRTAYARARVTNPDALPGNVMQPGAPSPGHLGDGIAGPTGRATPLDADASVPASVSDTMHAATISRGGNPVLAPPVAVPAPSQASFTPPGHTCAAGCLTVWRVCGSECAIGQSTCEVQCDDAYRTCMRGCF